MQAQEIGTWQHVTNKSQSLTCHTRHTVWPKQVTFQLEGATPGKEVLPNAIWFSIHADTTRQKKLQTDSRTCARAGIH
jgi:hypothetical protein